MQQNFWQKLFDFLASIKLAVIVILGLAVILAIATFIEAQYDSKTARYLVYGSPFFIAILGLLGVNVTFSALKRFPWKKDQLGFLMTHAGIVVILTGSFISHIWGIDGSMAIAEGDASNLVIMDRQMLFVEFDGGAIETFPVEFRWSPPKPGHEFTKVLPDNFRIAVDSYLHRAAAHENITNTGDTENPAIKVALLSSKANADGWLFADEAGRNLLSLGPLRVRFERAANLQQLNRFLHPGETVGGGELGQLHLKFPEGERKIDVSGNIDLPIKLPDLPYTVTITRYLPYAAVDGKKLVNKSKEPVNPCVELTVKWRNKQGNEEEEKHIVFARFPEFPTLFGKQNAGSNLKVYYEFIPPAASNGKQLLFIIDFKNQLHYRLWDGKKKIQTGEAKLGNEVETGWMDLKFSIKEFYQKAKSKLEYLPAPKRKGMTEQPPAIHLIAEGEKEKIGFWLLHGESQTLNLDGKKVSIAYGNATIPLPFTIQLEKFTVGRDPGTNNPASFTSNVILDQSGVFLHKKTSIYMNNPLKWGGYTFYQSSYQEIPGQPTVSILSVGKDPGRSVKYAGSILLIAGIIIMYFFKKFLPKTNV